MDYDDKQIGRNIKAIRNANRKSYEQFSGDISISDSLLEKIENGSRHATDEIIMIISKNTGFPFSDIKYGDLTWLEKGDFYFGEELRLEDFFEQFGFEEFTVELLKYLFPFVDDINLMNNEDFSAGLNIAYEKIQILKFNSKDCLQAIDYFIKASKSTADAEAAAINILSCFSYFYFFYVKQAVSINDIYDLQKTKIKSFSDYLVQVNSKISQAKYNERKKYFMQKYNSYLTKYMKILTASADYSDYAYYFLFIRYAFGMLDNEITMLDDSEMAVFSLSYFDCILKMGNQYAKALDDFLESV